VKRAVRFVGDVLFTVLVCATLVLFKLLDALDNKPD
jgi:hypothetical protein